MPLAKPGGFRRQTGFHIGLRFRKVLAVESLSHASGVPAPFSKGALRAVPADNFARWLSAIRHFPDPPGIVPAVEVGVSITSIKYHPQSKPELHRPQAPSVTCGDSSLPEGAMGFCLSTLDFCKLESACCNPSGKNQRFLPAPFDKGAFGRTIDTGRVREVTNRRKLSCALTAAARRL